jgi:hypothetical protein
MSVCARCGLDLESGVRVDLEDDPAPQPAPRAPAPPMAVSIIGGIAFMGSLALTVLSIALWLGGFDGCQYFVPICAFGIYAAVQFLRQKSVRLLILALSFGLAVDVVALIAMPVYHANMEASAVDRNMTSEKAEVVIPSVVDKLDTQKLTIGIGLILVYAGVVFYLMTPQVKRHFR